MNILTNRKIVDDAASMLSKNSEKMGSMGTRLQSYRRTSTGMTWFIIGAVVAVLLAWMVMYILIRLT
jgi:hypothetical protein